MDDDDFPLIDDGGEWFAAQCHVEEETPILAEEVRFHPEDWLPDLPEEM